MFVLGNLPNVWFLNPSLHLTPRFDSHRAMSPLTELCLIERGGQVAAHPGGGDAGQDDDAVAVRDVPPVLDRELEAQALVLQLLRQLLEHRLHAVVLGARPRQHQSQACRGA
jgi:hypothetical protein